MVWGTSMAMLLMVPTTRVPATGLDGHALAETQRLRRASIYVMRPPGGAMEASCGGWSALWRLCGTPTVSSDNTISCQR